ncbi:MAG: hypothetical protein Kow00107_07700 [Planctomycetota bacterium]
MCGESHQEGVEEEYEHADYDAYIDVSVGVHCGLGDYAVNQDRKHAIVYNRLLYIEDDKARFPKIDLQDIGSVEWEERWKLTEGRRPPPVLLRRKEGLQE